MTAPARVAVFGGDELRAAVVALGFTTADDEVDAAVIDASDADAVARAAALPPSCPRALVATAEHRGLLAAVGVDPARIAATPEPAVLGPVLVSLLPVPRRAPTRVVVITGVRGGVGRTLLATNLARRLARRAKVCLIDATGSGAAAWWLRCDATSWSSLEGLVDELSPDHLGVIAHDAARDLRLIGGPLTAPSAAIVTATMRAAAASDDIVIVDAPPVWDIAIASLRMAADRYLVLAYDDSASSAALDATAPTDDDWVIASQSRERRIGEHSVFRALPRDEAAVAGALRGRDAVGGGLGRAYDDLAELLAIDAS